VWPEPSRFVDAVPVPEHPTVDEFVSRRPLDRDAGRFAGIATLGDTRRYLGPVGHQDKRRMADVLRGP
jgi:hypothetical protein